MRLKLIPSPKAFLIGTFVFIFSALNSYAQTVEPAKLKVGDPSIDGAPIKPYVSNWRRTQIKPDGSKEVTDTSSDELVLTTFKGRAVLKETQRPRTGAQHGIYINIVDARTLAPILSQQLDDS